MFHVSDLILKDLVCFNVTISFYLFVHLSKNATIITWFSVSNCTRSACFGFISYGSKDIIMELVSEIGASGHIVEYSPVGSSIVILKDCR